MTDPRVTITPVIQPGAGDYTGIPTVVHLVVFVENDQLTSFWQVLDLKQVPREGETMSVTPGDFSELDELTDGVLPMIDSVQWSPTFDSAEVRVFVELTKDDPVVNWRAELLELGYTEAT